jgi:hypothetical protein
MHSMNWVREVKHACHVDLLVERATVLDQGGPKAEMTIGVIDQVLPELSNLQRVTQHGRRHCLIPPTGELLASDVGSTVMCSLPQGRVLIAQAACMSVYICTKDGPNNSCNHC